MDQKSLHWIGCLENGQTICCGILEVFDSKRFFIERKSYDCKYRLFRTSNLIRISRHLYYIFRIEFRFIFAVFYPYFHSCDETNCSKHCNQFFEHVYSPLQFVLESTQKRINDLLVAILELFAFLRLFIESTAKIEHKM